MVSDRKVLNAIGFAADTALLHLQNVAWCVAAWSGSLAILQRTEELWPGHGEVLWWLAAGIYSASVGLLGLVIGRFWLSCFAEKRGARRTLGAVAGLLVSSIAFTWCYVLVVATVNGARIFG